MQRYNIAIAVLEYFILVMVPPLFFLLVTLLFKLSEFGKVPLYFLHGVAVFGPTRPSTDCRDYHEKGNEEIAVGRGRLFQIKCSTDAEEGKRKAEDMFQDIFTLVVGKGVQLLYRGFHHVEARQQHETADYHEYAQHAESLQHVERCIVEYSLDVKQRN